MLEAVWRLKLHNFSVKKKDCQIEVLNTRFYPDDAKLIYILFYPDAKLKIYIRFYADANLKI